MIGFVYIGSDMIGEAEFSVTDKSMGGICGALVTTGNYQKYKMQIQQQCAEKGISNVRDFNYKIILSDHTELKPEGGIGITDLEGFDEILVESAGVHYLIIEKIDFHP